MSHRSFCKSKFNIFIKFFKNFSTLRATGLRLLLNIEVNEYLEDFSESYGAVIEVTNPREKFFPEENGYLVAPGLVTNIGFTAVSLKPFSLIDYFPCCFQCYFWFRKEMATKLGKRQRSKQTCQDLGWKVHDW